MWLIRRCCKAPIIQVLHTPPVTQIDLQKLGQGTIFSIFCFLSPTSHPESVCFFVPFSTLHPLIPFPEWGCDFCMDNLDVHQTAPRRLTEMMDVFPSKLWCSVMGFIFVTYFFILKWQFGCLDQSLFCICNIWIPRNDHTSYVCFSPFLLSTCATMGLVASTQLIYNKLPPLHWKRILAPAGLRNHALLPGVHLDWIHVAFYVSIYFICVCTCISVCTFTCNSLNTFNEL